MKWYRTEAGLIADFKGNFKCEISSSQYGRYAQTWKVEVKHVTTGEVVSVRVRGLPSCKEAAEGIVGAWLKGLTHGRSNPYA
jgi:hypothetical protein